MKRYVTALLSVLCIASSAVTWHVDPEWPAPTGNGTSWGSPWSSFADIKWLLVKPGDTIELARGDFGEESMVVGKSGTVTAPITVRLAADSDKRGHVYLRAFALGIYDNITLDGHLKAGFVPPASVHDIYQITNNIGIHVHNETGPGVYVRGSRTGIRILWLETDKCGEFADRSTHGVYINGDTRLSEIGYCWFRDQHWGDGVNRGSGIQPVRFDDLHVHHCIVSKVGNDAFQITGGGAEISWCLVDGWDAAGQGGHPDCFQTWGSYYSIHHNIVKDFSPGDGYYASLAYAQMSNPVNGNYLLYNNLFINEKVPTETGFIFLFDAWWSPGKHNTNVVITNLFVANNLWHIWKGGAVGHTIHFKADKSRGTNDHYTITNCYFLNNAVIHCNDYLKDNVAVSLASTNLQPSNIGYDQWMFDHNVVAGPSFLIRYMGDKPWANAEALNAASPFKHNTSELPVFQSYKAKTPPYDFRLDDIDTVARGNGTNLMAFLAMAPMIDMDLDGMRRDPALPWDIGPYQFDGIDATDVPVDECEELRKTILELEKKIRELEGQPHVRGLGDPRFNAGDNLFYEYITLLNTAIP